MTSPSTRYMAHSPLVVRNPYTMFYSRSVFRLEETGSDGTIHFWDKDARTRLKSRVFSSFHS